MLGAHGWGKYPPGVPDMGAFARVGITAADITHCLWVSHRIGQGVSWRQSIKPQVPTRISTKPQLSHRRPGFAMFLRLVAFLCDWVAVASRPNCHLAASAKPPQKTLHRATASGESLGPTVLHRDGSVLRPPIHRGPELLLQLHGTCHRVE